MTIGLECHGACVLAAESAQMALLIFEAQRPDVIVADLELADLELDGRRFMQAVRELEHEKRTPGIAVSVHNTAATRASLCRPGSRSTSQAAHPGRACGLNRPSREAGAVVGPDTVGRPP